MGNEQQQTIPHLIIKFKMVDGEEQFEWGVTKGIPMMGLLGALCRAQIALDARDRAEYDKDVQYQLGAFVLKYCYGDFVHYCDPTIPINSLIGTIDTIKDIVKYTIHKSAEAQKSMQRVLLGVDGKPMRG